MAALFTRLYPTEDVHDGGTEEGLFTLIFCTFIHQVFIEYLSKAREGWQMNQTSSLPAQNSYSNGGGCRADSKVIIPSCADSYEGMSWDHMKEATAPILASLGKFCKDMSSEIKLSISQKRQGTLL